MTTTTFPAPTPTQAPRTPDAPRPPTPGPRGARLSRGRAWGCGILLALGAAFIAGGATLTTDAGGSLMAPLGSIGGTLIFLTWLFGLRPARRALRIVREGLEVDAIATQIRPGGANSLAALIMNLSRFHHIYARPEHLQHWQVGLRFETSDGRSHKLVDTIWLGHGEAPPEARSRVRAYVLGGRRPGLVLHDRLARRGIELAHEGALLALGANR